MGLKISRHGRFPGNKNRRVAPKARFQPRNAMSAALYHNRKGREEREPAAPTVINMSNETVPQSAGSGYIVGRFFTDGYPAPTYTLDADPDNKFEIVGDELRATTTFTFPGSHSITVTADNGVGGGVTDSFSIVVTQVVVEPSVISLSNNSIPATSPVGTVVGTLSSDGTAPVTYTKTADPDNKFEIVGNELRTTATVSFPATHNVSVRASNSAGFADETFAVTIAEQVPDMPTTLQSSVTYEGVTFNFNQPVPVGQDVMGYPVVLSTNAFEITSITPASATVGSTTAHGAMIDPLVTNDGPQGFDELLADGSLAGQATPTPYSAVLNVDPAINGNIAIAAGSTHVLVKSVRRAGVTTPVWASFDQFVPLTILPTAPRQDFYRPAMSNPTQTLRYEGNVNMACLRSLTPPASSTITPTWATIEAFVDKLKTLPHFGPGGEKLRRYEFDNLHTQSGYSGDYGIPRAMPLYMLHSDALTDTQKRKLVNQVIRNALDTIGVEEVNPGLSWAEGAGQYHGYHPQAYFAAYLLDDIALLAVATTMRSNAFTHPRWVDAADEGSFDVDFIGPVGQNQWFRDQFRSQDIGKPWWSEKWRGSQPTARYLTITLPVGATEVFPVMLLQAQSNIALDGATMLLMGGPDDATNWRAAVLRTFDYTLTNSEPRTSRKHFALIDGNVGTPFDAREFYETTGANWRGALTGLSRWEGVPEVSDYETNDLTGPDRVTAGVSDGSVDYDWDLGIAWTALSRPITTRYLLHSWDGIQTFERTVPSRVGTATGYPKGAGLFFQWAEENALGRGKPSYIWPFTDQVSDVPDRRNYVTVPGTTNAGAPVNTAAPAIFWRPYGPYGGNDPVAIPPGSIFEAVTGTVTGDQVFFYAGTGDWNAANGTPDSFAYQWYRDGAPIAGATNQYYARTVDDFSTTLTAGVTPFNGAVAGSEVLSAGITIPAAPVIPTDTIIDTDFQGEFPLVYPNVFSTAVGTDCTPTHWASQPFNEDLSNPVEGEPDLTPYGVVTPYGGFGGAKTNARPSLDIKLTGEKQLQPGSSYSVRLHLPLGFISADASDNWTEERIRLGSTQGASNLLEFTHSLAGPPADDQQADISRFPYTFEINTTVNVSQYLSAADLWVEIYQDVSSGGVNGAWPLISLAEVIRTGAYSTPLTPYSVDFTTDQTGDWVSLDSGSHVWNSGDQSLDYTTGAAWGGISTPGVSVDASLTYRLTADIESVTAAQLDIVVGTTQNGSEIISGTTQRVNAGTRGTITQDFVVPSGTIFAKVRQRGGSGGTLFKVHSFSFELVPPI